MSSSVNNQDGINTIRFIDSGYKDLFRIPDGGTIQVDYPDGCYSYKCEYVDDFHTRIGGEAFHICELAELLERGGGICRPETEPEDDRAAWKTSYGQSLLTEKSASGEGYDYQLLNNEYSLINEGKLEGAHSLLEARDMALEFNGLNDWCVSRQDFDSVADRAGLSSEALHQGNIPKSSLETLRELKESGSKASEHSRSSGTKAIDETVL